MNRIINALKFGWWAFKNPETISPSNFKMLGDLLCLILKVSSEHRHMMTHIACIHPETGKNHEIVSIWAGAGIDSDPIKRITELINENETLKSRLSEKFKIKK